MTKIAYIKRDRMERFNLKRGWFVDAWRLVSRTGEDLVQPWFETKTDAKAYARSAGIDVVGEPT